MKMSIEYFTLQKQHEKQYGERTIVLYQCGIFYEIYEFCPSDCRDEKYKIDKDTGIKYDYGIGHAISLSVTLNCVLSTGSSDKPYSVKNPHKIGFPIISYEKNLATLLANDYVVVKVDQFGTGKSVTRAVTEILSPTMQIDTISLNRSTSNIACIYIEYQKGSHNYDNILITTGVSVIDIIKGQNKVCEYYSKLDDQVQPIQELYRFLISHAPRELVIHLSDMPPGLDINTDDKPNKYIKYLERVLELRRFDRLTVNINSVPVDYKKIPYQIEFLNKVFTKQVGPKQKSMLKIIQKRNDKIISDLGMENMTYGRISYLLLLQHCHSYNPATILKLSKPNLQWLDDKYHLILTHNAIVQLDLIPQKENKHRRKAEIDSLLSVLDHNRTHLGKRVLENLLQNPMLDPVEIQSYYDMVEEMGTKTVEGDPLWFVLDKLLKELPDIGRLQRKLELKLISPKELSMLYSAYIKIINIYVLILNNKVPILHSKLLSQEDVKSFNEFINRFGLIINFDNMECSSTDVIPDSKDKILEFSICPIKPGIYDDIDKLNDRLVIAENGLQLIVDHLNSFLTKTVGKKIKIGNAKSQKGQGAKKQGPDIAILLTTTSKASTLASSRIDTNLCGVLHFTGYTTTDKKISSDIIDYYCQEIDTVKMDLRKKLYVIYESLIDEMVGTYTFYTAIAGLVAKVDLLHSYALVADKYNYHKPELDTSDGPSYFQARDIRHAISERLIDGIYITNDLSLGRGSVEENRANGILLFGLNQSGKSTLTKAIGLMIIMAQCGCYVAGKLKYKPYNKIITRMAGGDNIFTGQSSFNVEMTELRTIMRNCDEHTLSLCDELAKGSENHSAGAIIVAAVRTLIRKNSTYISSTHQHHLVDMPQITSIDKSKLKIMHLSVDEKDQTLIYDRKLKDSAGSSVYGVLVVKSLGFPDEFMNDANEVLSYILGNSSNILDTKTSRHNSEVYIHECARCNRTRLQVELHTHHIKEQNLANKRGLIEHFHKNIKDNLIVLCCDCHIHLHKEGLELETIETSEGKLVRLKS